MAGFEALEDDARLPGWKRWAFVDGEDRRHVVYRQGAGPGVLVIHEIPGITPAVAAFGQRVVDEGFTVVMPHLLGEPGRSVSNLYVLRQLTRACVSREFVCLLTRRTSAATRWLRELASALHGELGGPGVGVVGMCITGGFALAMAVDEAVIAPVLSQPSLPFAVLPGQRRDVNLSPGDREIVAQRVTRDGITVLGLRFTSDWRVGDRFATFRDLLGDNFEPFEIDSGQGEDFPKKAHSVLTYMGECASRERLEAAADRVITLFRGKLAP